MNEESSEASEATWIPQMRESSVLVSSEGRHIHD